MERSLTLCLLACSVEAVAGQHLLAFCLMLCVFVRCRLIEPEIFTMCILFVYINNNAVDADEYQLIIAMNRDEFIDRPTLPAHFWNEHCISG